MSREENVRRKRKGANSLYIGGGFSKKEKEGRGVVGGVNCLLKKNIPAQGGGKVKRYTREKRLSGGESNYGRGRGK